MIVISVTSFLEVDVRSYIVGKHVLSATSVVHNYIHVCGSHHTAAVSVCVLCSSLCTSLEHCCTLPLCP